MGFSHKGTSESLRGGYIYIFIFFCFTQGIVINENPRVSYNSQISNSLCYTKLNQPILNEDSRREMKRSAQMLMIMILLFIYVTCSRSCWILNMIF